MNQPFHPFLLALLLSAAACTKHDSDSAGPNPDKPILDPVATGWDRVGQIPLTSPAGINFINTMKVYDMQLNGTSLRVLYREQRSLSGTMAPATFKAEVPAGGTGTITSLKITEHEAYPNSTTDYYDYFFFRPGTFQAYQGVNAFPHGNLAVATSQVLDENGVLYTTGSQPCVLNGNGGTFSGAAPQMLADGTVLYSAGRFGSGGVNGAYWWHWLAAYKNGRWRKAISQGLANYTPHSTTTYAAVPMPSGRLHGALITFDQIAIADTVAPATPSGQGTIPTVAATAFPAFVASENDQIIAKGIGNTVVFATWNPRSTPVRFNAYRWTEGTTSVQLLYANVALPTGTTLLGNCQLDDSGAVFCFATVPGPGNGSSTLLRIDGTGVKQLTPPVDLLGRYDFSGLCQLGGQWYAAVGPALGIGNSPDSPRRMELLRLRP